MTEENILNPVSDETLEDAVSEAVSETPAEEVFKNAAETAEETLFEVADEAAAEAVEITEAAAEEIHEAVEEVTEPVAEEINETAGENTEEITGVTDEAAEAVKEAVDEVTEAAGEAESAAEEITETAEEVTKAVTEEVADAAEAAAEDIADEAKAAAEEITEAAKEDEGLSNLIDEAVPDVSDEALAALSEEAEKISDDLNAEKEKNGKVKWESSQDNALERVIEPPVILFDHVHKEYEGQIEDSVALVDVSFQIQKGEFVFIVGPSGSGKSTMIRLMMREISPSGGNIYIAGKELAKLRRRQVSKYRRNIGIVFQDFRLLPDRNVYDNVAFAQRVVGASKRDIPKEVSKVLHLVGLSQKYKSFPNELSGGEQQRVAIARALVNNPMIILADEPTGNLDPQNSYEIMSLLEEINRRGTTVVIVTHDREVVDQMQKRVVSLQDGVIVEDKKGGYIYG